MKLKRTYRLVRSLLLIGLLSSGFETYAGHSQRTEYGVVQTVDYATKSFAIIPDKRTNAFTFIFTRRKSHRRLTPAWSQSAGLLSKRVWASGHALGHGSNASAQLINAGR